VSCQRNDRVLLTDKPSRFLLASLHVDSLVSKKTTTRLKSALDNLSHGSEALRDAYDNVIERIDGQVHDDCTLAKSVLSWISYAHRPLTTKELCHALAVKIGDEDFDSDNIPDIEDILSVCAGLVTVDEESQIIRLVHYTTQEYLEGIRETWHPRAQYEIASTCLTYLCFEPFRRDPSIDHGEWKSRRKEYSFLGYSAWYWPKHVAVVEEEVCELAMILLRNNNLVASALSQKGGSLTVESMTGLHVTAGFGLVHLSKGLLSWAKKEKIDLGNSKDRYGETPLCRGVWSGWRNVVELLLDDGEVDVNAVDTYGHTALRKAIDRGHREIVELLLATKKVNVNDIDIYGETALLLAVKRGQKEIVELILDTGKVDFGAKVHGSSLLSLAVREGHKEIVELLLGSREADFETLDKAELLMYAIHHGYKDVVEFLLGISTDSSKIIDRWPLLALIAANRHKGISELIGSEEINPDTKDGLGNRTLLTCAAREGHVDLVKLLLNAGADVDAKDNRGTTALMKATREGHKETAKLLLDRGANVHAKNRFRSTALRFASLGNCKEILELLLDRGADVDAKDGEGFTPLMTQVLASCGRIEMVELLLDRGADIHARDKNGSTVLMLAVIFWAHRETVELLLDRGSGIHAKKKMDQQC
jgi:ankyrin repeat protein